MTRRHRAFICEQRTLIGTLDDADGTTGLLIVSGGNEIRSGAFAGQAALAHRIAAAGHPVFRFDRRGTGDSEGVNRGFRGSAPDIAAALATFRRECPQLTRVIGFGNCDAASALMLARGAGCDALVLSNPWTIDDGVSDALPPSAVRSRYAEKLRNPDEMVRLLRGGVNLRKLFGGLAMAMRTTNAASSLAQEMAAQIQHFDGDVRILLAQRDRTAQAFARDWPADDPRIRRCAGGSHAYVEPDASAWLERELRDALAAPGER